MYYYEAIDCRLDLLHTTNGQQFQRQHIVVYFESNGNEVKKMNVFPIRGLEARHRNLWRCILGYSSRSLTHQSDKLNAFLGILRNYETLHGMHHIWGVPIF
jgi:hypothetical protein